MNIFPVGLAEIFEDWLVLNRLFHVVLRQYLDTLPGCVSIVTFSIVGKEQNV